MRTRLAAAVIVAMVTIGVSIGVAVVAAGSVGASSQVANCNPVADKADWLLDKEACCYNTNAPCLAPRR